MKDIKEEKRVQVIDRKLFEHRVSVGDIAILFKIE